MTPAIFFRRPPAATSACSSSIRSACRRARPRVFVRCRAEFILQGKCGLSGYAREAGGIAERPKLAAAGPPSSAKRAGRCFLACAALPIDRTPYSIEEELADWIAAGVDAFKIEGRGLPADKLVTLVSRIRNKLDEAITGLS